MADLTYQHQRKGYRNDAWPDEKWGRAWSRPEPCGLRTLADLLGAHPDLDEVVGVCRATLRSEVKP